MENTLIQPLIAALISSLIAIRAYRRKSLDLSGALSGFVVMTIHIALGYRFVSTLLFPFALFGICLDAEKTRENERKRLIECLCLCFCLGMELCCLCSFSLRLSSQRWARRKSDASMLISRKVDKEIGTYLCFYFVYFRYDLLDIVSVVGGCGIMTSEAQNWHMLVLSSERN